MVVIAVVALVVLGKMLLVETIGATVLQEDAKGITQQF